MYMYCSTAQPQVKGHGCDTRSNDTFKAQGIKSSNAVQVHTLTCAWITDG